MDVFYEVPQEATADGFVLSQTREAAAQRARATQVAARLGLQLVGWAFAHPPRAHEVTVSELEQMAPMQKLLNSSQARPSMGGGRLGKQRGWSRRWGEGGAEGGAEWPTWALRAALWAPALPRGRRAAHTH